MNKREQVVDALAYTISKFVEKIDNDKYGFWMSNVDMAMYVRNLRMALLFLHGRNPDEVFNSVG